MAKRNKLQKFAEMLTFPNVFENFNLQSPSLSGKDGEEVDFRGNWSEKHFENQNPITLELACGGGEYAVDMGKMFPNRNFIGVDIKGARIWRGAKYALENNLKNVSFVRTRIEQISLFFAPNEIDEIWLTFPDPFLREGKANKRLTSLRFLQEYRKIIKPGGYLHLKTDDPTLYNFTIETLQNDENCTIIEAIENIHNQPFPIPELGIKTKYEGMNISGSNTIKWIKFKIH